jgi:hypothetical protein
MMGLFLYVKLKESLRLVITHYTDGYKNRCPYKRNPGCICVNDRAIEVALKRMKQAICDEMKRRGIK